MSSAPDQALAPINALSASARSFVAFCRWFSALVVMLSHLRAMMFFGWGELAPQMHTVAIRALYTLTAFAHEAVVVFFVLSGFLVAGPNIDRAKGNLFDHRAYAIDRFSRIYVTLVPALMLTIAADAIGRTFFSWTGFFDGTNVLVQQRFPKAFLGDALTHFAGNLAMLQPIYVPVLGSNVPLWSLSYEVWFYVWFGVTAFAFQRNRRSFWLFATTATLALVLFHWSALVGLLIWCLGALAYQWRRWPQSIPLALLALAVSLGLSLSPRTSIAGLLFKLTDPLVGVSFAWLLALMKSRSYRILARCEPLNQRLSDFSYSLYVIHFPTMLVILALTIEAVGLAPSLKTGLVPDARSATAYAATAAVTALIAFAFSLLVERRTGAVRRWLKSATSPQ